ncbi:ribonuclease toxin immunity protein CdiI [Paenibacillus faecis]|uniref:ribonuclease toxin immunity protein CdiI n=1 Tax=Paenibacillus faecis TaxID=862114 RepID=UPI001BCC454B
MGTEVENGDDSVIIDYHILFLYLKLAVERFIEQNPYDEQEVEKYLKDMKRNLNIVEKL